MQTDQFLPILNALNKNGVGFLELYFKSNLHCGFFTEGIGGTNKRCETSEPWIIHFSKNDEPIGKLVVDDYFPRTKFRRAGKDQVTEQLSFVIKKDETNIDLKNHIVIILTFTAGYYKGTCSIYEAGPEDIIKFT